ncbi:ADP-ribosylglycohydrolase family protein [Haloarchaeobius amylolyticus]|uniref:ADP-ribosylglycohydrolase family protein n=1 Tax=Haloarchaeobius amylolyticus TaxID=1198296 RepID=UPI002270C010|nr:ADP-ribosylglycohydrolase family protein [Haloarchaeobius amylolyticus]
MTTARDDRAAGTLLGLACGDALGRPVEFRSPASIESTHGRLDEMVGHGTHDQPAGTVTDDTDMMLCIARSLAERGEFDGEDVAERFVGWYESGPFDIGIMTGQSIRAFRDGVAWDEAGRQVWEASAEGSNAGNGSVMRCVPHALAFGDDPDELVAVSRESSAITHADPRCTWGCALVNLVVASLLDGAEPMDALDAGLDRVRDEAPAELVTAAEAVPTMAPDDLQNSGYVVTTVQAGFFHGLRADTAADAIVEAVAMGGDADTIGAVAGAVAGARFGASALPEDWLDAVDVTEECRDLAGDLLALRDS